MKILICTDGSPAAEEAATLVSCLEYPAGTEITLLGVSEADDDKADINASLERMEAALKNYQPHISRKLRSGHPVEEIMHEADEANYDLVAVGERGRNRQPFLFKAGSTTTKLSLKMMTPLLVARNVPDKMLKILFCASAEAPSGRTLTIGGNLVSHIPAEVGLLHVSSKVVANTSPNEVTETAESAMAQGTRAGKRLSTAIQNLKQAGINGPITSRLRRGLVVDQVLAEMKSGGYNLLVIGSHFQPGESHWLESLLDDVAGQLLDHAEASVLVV
jgi:nucleotide-binding universal stress UspA family protein